MRRPAAPKQPSSTAEIELKTARGGPAAPPTVGSDPYMEKFFADRKIKRINDPELIKSIAGFFRMVSNFKSPALRIGDDSTKFHNRRNDYCDPYLTDLQRIIESGTTKAEILEKVAKLKHQFDHGDVRRRMIESIEKDERDIYNDARKRAAAPAAAPPASAKDIDIEDGLKAWAKMVDLGWYRPTDKDKQLRDIINDATMKNLPAVQKIRYVADWLKENAYAKNGDRYMHGPLLAAIMDLVIKYGSDINPGDHPWFRNNRASLPATGVVAAHATPPVAGRAAAIVPAAGVVAAPAAPPASAKDIDIEDGLKAWAKMVDLGWYRPTDKDKQLRDIINDATMKNLPAVQKIRYVADWLKENAYAKNGDRYMHGPLLAVIMDLVIKYESDINPGDRPWFRNNRASLPATGVVAAPATPPVAGRAAAIVPAAGVVAAPAAPPASADDMGIVNDLKNWAEMVNRSEYKPTDEDKQLRDIINLQARMGALPTKRIQHVTAWLKENAYTKDGQRQMHGPLLAAIMDLVAKYKAHLPPGNQLWVQEQLKKAAPAASDPMGEAVMKAFAPLGVGGVILGPGPPRRHGR